jgi:hypothetical protein
MSEQIELELKEDSKIGNPKPKRKGGHLRKPKAQEIYDLKKNFNKQKKKGKEQIEGIKEKLKKINTKAVEERLSMLEKKLADHEKRGIGNVNHFHDEIVNLNKRVEGIMSSLSHVIISRTAKEKKNSTQWDIIVKSMDITILKFWTHEIDVDQFLKIASETMAIVRASAEEKISKIGGKPHG